MKTPAEYVAATCVQPFHSPAGPTIPLADAIQAVEEAIDDANRYHQLLARAIRNSKSTPSPQPPTA